MFELTEEQREKIKEETIFLRRAVFFKRKPAPLKNKCIFNIKRKLCYNPNKN